MFRIVFVLDILNGIAVHAVKGERRSYRPVHEFSRICTSSDPVEIVRFLRPQEAYIADLDRIQGIGSNDPQIKMVSGYCRTMADTGVSSMEDIDAGFKIADTVIIGTETASLKLIESAAFEYPGKVSVSIDIKNGVILSKDSDLNIDPLELVSLLNEYDISDLIVLELIRVGTGSGIDISFLDRAARSSDHDILIGGGVKDMEDLELAEKAGVSGALVATAVHNGSIPGKYLQ